MFIEIHHQAFDEDLIPTTKQSILINVDKILYMRSLTDEERVDDPHNSTTLICAVLECGYVAKHCVETYEELKTLLNYQGLIMK